MKNTFRSTLKKEDFIIWERLQFKRSRLIPGLIMAVVFIIYAGYYYMVSQNLTLVISTVIATAFCGAYAFYVYNKGIEKRIDRYIAADSQYLSPYEISIDENTIEYKNLPMINEAGVVVICPYSIIRAIYETENYFYFYIGYEIKILPKRDIPDEMKQQVFSRIKKNRNCIFIK